MEGEEGSRLHIVVFPWLAFGHMLPYLGLSKSLALRGHLISYVAPPKNIQRLPKVPFEISHLIRFVPLPLPRVDGMAEGVAATSDVPFADVRYLLDATDALEEPFSAFVNGAAPKPDWIIHDVFQHWIPNIGVPYLSVSMASACCPVFFGCPADDADDEQGPRDYTVPPPWIPFPTKVAWRRHELLKIAVDAKVQFNHSGARKDYSVRLSPYRRAKVLAARSCMELEGEWLTLASQVHGKPVIPVGLLLPSAVTEREEGGEATAEIVSWLDERNERSVVYVALGSEVTISSEQLRELALGLEIAKLPFLWALRRPFGSMLPEGFKERTEGFGKVVMGWAPQLRVLAHPSVGGFLTHCGWSSIIEGLQYGRPLVMLPIMGDQCLNARMVGEKGLGVEVERNEDDGSFTRNEVKKALSLIMVDEEGDAFRKKAQEMKEAFADEERQEEYLDDFVQYLLSNRNSKA